MKTRAFFLSLLLASFCAACKGESPFGSGPGCENELDILELPITWTLRNLDEPVAYLTVGADGQPSIAYAANAKPEEAAKMAKDFESIAASDTIGYSYNVESDGMRLSCGGEAKKGTPEYAAGLRMHIHSVLYMDATIVEGPPADAVPEPPVAP
jgi:hypothetical protein